MGIKEEFKIKFNYYQCCKIAVYGLGVNAEQLFSMNLPDFNFVAVVDDFHAGEEKFGKTIITIEQALVMADIIIIAASPNSTRKVFSRIANIVDDKLPIFDMRGNRLNGKMNYCENEYWKCDE